MQWVIPVEDGLDKTLLDGDITWRVDGGVDITWQADTGDDKDPDMTWQVEEGEDIEPATDLNIIMHVRYDTSHKMSSQGVKSRLIQAPMWLNFSLWWPNPEN